MPTKQLIINHSSFETRVALIEDDQLVEVYFDRPHQNQAGIVQNIYKGKIVRILPGIQAAFVNIGHEKAAFLYSGDVVNNQEEVLISQRTYPDISENDFDESFLEKAEKNVTPIEKTLNTGQTVIVQIRKDPLGNKGSRSTMFLSLAGHFLVLIPGFQHVVGYQKKLEMTKNVNN